MLRQIDVGFSSNWFVFYTLSIPHFPTSSLRLSTFRPLFPLSVSLSLQSRFSPTPLPSLLSSLSLCLSSSLVAQADRLASLGRCTHLTQQLSHPLSLDDARALITAEDAVKPMPLSVIVPNNSSSFAPVKNKEDQDAKGGGGRDIKSNNSIGNEAPGRGKENEKSPELFSQNWVQDLPSYGLNDAVDLHTQTIEALRNKSKWSLVAVPLNLTGPPVDIAALNLESDREKGRMGRKGHSNPRLASAWADGEDFLMFCCLLSSSCQTPGASCILILFPAMSLSFQSIDSTATAHHYLILTPHSSHSSPFSLPSSLPSSLPYSPPYSYPPLLPPRPLSRRGCRGVLVLGGICDTDLEPPVPVWNQAGPRSTGY
jgi:hypothetical protein